MSTLQIKQSFVLKNIFKNIKNMANFIKKQQFFVHFLVFFAKYVILYLTQRRLLWGFWEELEVF